MQISFYDASTLVFENLSSLEVNPAVNQTHLGLLSINEAE